MAINYNKTEPPPIKADELPYISPESVRPGQLVIYRPFEFVTFNHFYEVMVGQMTNLERRPLPYLVLKKEGSSLLTVPIDFSMAKSLKVSGIQKELWKYLVPIEPKEKESDDQLEPLKLESTGKYEGWLDIRRIIEIRPDSRDIKEHSGSIRIRHTNLVRGEEEKKLLDNLLNAARNYTKETERRHGLLSAAAEKRWAAAQERQRKHEQWKEGQSGMRR